VAPCSAQGRLVPVFLPGTTPLPEEIPRALRVLLLQPDLCEDPHKQLVDVVIDANGRFDELAVVRCCHVLSLCSKRQENFSGALEGVLVK